MIENNKRVTERQTSRFDTAVAALGLRGVVAGLSDYFATARDIAKHHRNFAAYRLQDNEHAAFGFSIRFALTGLGISYLVLVLAFWTKGSHLDKMFYLAQFAYYLCVSILVWHWCLWSFAARGRWRSTASVFLCNLGIGMPIAAFASAPMYYYLGSDQFVGRIDREILRESLGEMRLSPWFFLASSVALIPFLIAQIWLLCRWLECVHRISMTRVLLAAACAMNILYFHNVYILPSILRAARLGSRVADVL